MACLWILGFIIIFVSLSYQRAALSIWALSLCIYFILFSILSDLSALTVSGVGFVFLIVLSPFFIPSIRRRFFTQFILKIYRKNQPPMSTTEKEALAAGTVGWEGELFSGKPNWDKLLNYPPAMLSSEEKDFLDGPVETLCAMIDDWEITQHRLDLPPAIWDFLKSEGFFSLIIPKKYGGKAFSAFAHSQVLTKVYSRSISVATTIAVPNSLGPAELLLHYGTETQKNYYLPRLARGEEIPCFALTGPSAGSDAGAMTDKGIITWGTYNNEEILGIRLNWNKRYITLAPVATVVGLAFKLEDPNHLLGNKTHLGITLALIPRDTPGVTIGRRHFPCNIVFQNGPTQGKDVFIPLDWIIGGPEMVGQGWRMLMECLAAGRAISLPASGISGGKVNAYATLAYARIRKQFNVPIGYFEGIQEVLARIVGKTYIMDATRTFTASIIDLGEKPAVASAITKYHVTELSRGVGNDAMDVQGGKGICLGPKNFIGRSYESIPIAITVEGANILTRNMIIFGQGVMRCHPYILKEIQTASETYQDAFIAFDQIFTAHVGFILSNFFRTFILGICGSLISWVNVNRNKRYFQHASRFSAAFAWLTDICMITFGATLKRKENISARLGDIVSYLYLLSAVLKHFKEQGECVEDLPLVKWASEYCLYQVQESIQSLLKNFPNRAFAFFLKWIIFPWGKHFSPPSDATNREVVKLFLSPTASRDRLTAGIFKTKLPQNFLSLMEDALIKVIASESVEVKLKKQALRGDTILEKAKNALEEKIITTDEFDKIAAAEKAREQVIAVDDFSIEELIPGSRLPTTKSYASYPPKD